MQVPKFKAVLITVALLVCGSVWAATVWKWIDKNGVVHYSDQPVPGAVQVDLNVQTYESQAAAAAPSGRTTSAPNNKTSVPAYELIEIWKPANEQTFIGTAGQVSVSVRVEPRVQQGHSLRLELDGQRVSEPNSAVLDFELKEIARGAHTLSASIVTRDGQTLIQSSPITFFMRQPVVQQSN